jgi:hypothetical protein
MPIFKRPLGSVTVLVNVENPLSIRKDPITGGTKIQVGDTKWSFEESFEEVLGWYGQKEHPKAVVTKRKPRGKTKGAGQ